MGPTAQKSKTKGFAFKSDISNKAKSSTTVVKKKKKWIHDRKVFEGSVKEGQGFAFKRRQKVKHEYNKLLRHEKKNQKKPQSRALYEDVYPEHLKHLYLAEAEKLRNEAWTHQVKRRKMRMQQRQVKEADEVAPGDAPGDASGDAPGDAPGDASGDAPGDAPGDASGDAPRDASGYTPSGSEMTGAASENPETTASLARESLPMSNRMRKKMEKKTSYQKTKEEFESIREKRRKKKEEYLKNKQQREEAIQRYKQKKKETFQLLSKKTKRGQPNLNLHMEYLLQKIQGAHN